jgi:hypothetical protein
VLSRLAGTRTTSLPIWARSAKAQTKAVCGARIAAVSSRSLRGTAIEDTDKHSAGGPADLG